MTDHIVCTQCGYVGKPKSITKGSILIEMILWLCLLIPGLIYSAWRLSSRYQGCPTCGSATVIPRDSMMAQKFLRENAPDQVGAVDPIRPPSQAAHNAGASLGRAVGRLTR